MYRNADPEFRYGCGDAMTDKVEVRCAVCAKSIMIDKEVWDAIQAYKPDMKHVCSKCPADMILKIAEDQI